MFRIDTRNATADGKFQEYPATILSPEWLNSVQEELAHAIEDVGIRLDQEHKANHSQLLEAVNRKAKAFYPKVFVRDLNQVPSPEVLIQGLEDLIRRRTCMHVQIILVRTRPNSGEKCLTKRSLQYFHLQDQSMASWPGEFCFYCNREHDGNILLACLNDRQVSPVPTHLIQIVNQWGPQDA